MMEIPKHLKILGKIVTVKKVHSTEIDCAGDWDDSWYCIRLKDLDDPLYPKDKVEEALLHEVFEALNSFCDLEVDHKTLSILSEGLYQVMRDNNLDFRREENL